MSNNLTLPLTIGELQTLPYHGVDAGYSSISALRQRWVTMLPSGHILYRYGDIFGFGIDIVHLFGTMPQDTTVSTSATQMLLVEQVILRHLKPVFDGLDNAVKVWSTRQYYVMNTRIPGDNVPGLTFPFIFFKFNNEVTYLPILDSLVKKLLNMPPYEKLPEPVAEDYIPTFECGKLNVGDVVDYVGPDREHQGIWVIFARSLKDGKSIKAARFSHTKTYGYMEFLTVPNDNHFKVSDVKVNFKSMLFDSGIYDINAAYF